LSIEEKYSWCFPKCLWKNKFSYVSINNSIGTKTDSDKLPAELAAQLEALEKGMNGYGKPNLEDKTVMS